MPGAALFFDPLLLGRVSGAHWKRGLINEWEYRGSATLCKNKQQKRKADQTTGTASKAMVVRVSSSSNGTVPCQV